MAELAAKGADINIIADFTGDDTGADLGRTVGRNEDGTVDQGESITIYINMNPGSAPVTDIAFAETIVHELLHTFGDPALDAAIDAPGSTIDRDLRNDIFQDYDYSAPAAPGSGATVISDISDSGGTLVGSVGYDILSGSDVSDILAPGLGGSLVYSGGGDDRIVLALGGGVDEIIDSAGIDTIELPAGTALSSMSARWSQGQNYLVVMVNGQYEAIIVDAGGSGAVEQIWIDGVSHALAALPTTTNAAPDSAPINATVNDSFYGGFVANGAVFDANGDTLSYRLGSVTGDYSEEDWTVDSETGMISAYFMRFAEPGSKFTVLTMVVSDGLDTSHVSVLVRWGNSGELEPPIGSAFLNETGPPMMDAMLDPAILPAMPLDTTSLYG